MGDLATALALVLVIEGVLYSLFPDGMRRMVVQAMMLPRPAVRFGGLAAAFVGVGAIWLIRH